jgi:hypothetical protein
MVKVHFFHMDIQFFFRTICWNDYSSFKYLGFFAKNQLTLYAWVYFWVCSSVLLIFMYPYASTTFLFFFFFFTHIKTTLSWWLWFWKSWNEVLWPLKLWSSKKLLWLFYLFHRKFNSSPYHLFQKLVGVFVWITLIYRSIWKELTV